VSAEQTFQELVDRLDPAMLIVTASAGGEHSGCLAAFATQASIDPARFLVGVSRTNHTFRVACAADVLAVHVVPRRAFAIAELFGGRSGDEVDKFARCAWHPGPSDVPVLDDLPTWFAGRVVDRLHLGDHVGFLLEPVVAHLGPSEPVLRMRRTAQIEPGHEP